MPHDRTPTEESERMAKHKEQKSESKERSRRSRRKEDAKKKRSRGKNKDKKRKRRSASSDTSSQDARQKAIKSHTQKDRSDDPDKDSRPRNTRTRDSSTSRHNLSEKTQHDALLEEADMHLMNIDIVAKTMPKTTTELEEAYLRAAKKNTEVDLEDVMERSFVWLHKRLTGFQEPAESSCKE